MRSFIIVGRGERGVEITASNLWVDISKLKYIKQIGSKNGRKITNLEKQSRQHEHFFEVCNYPGDAKDQNMSVLSGAQYDMFKRSDEYYLKHVAVQ